MDLEDPPSQVRGPSFQMEADRDPLSRGTELEQRSLRMMFSEDCFRPGWAHRQGLGNIYEEPQGYFIVGQWEEDATANRPRWVGEIYKFVLMTKTGIRVAYLPFIIEESGDLLQLTPVAPVAETIRQSTHIEFYEAYVEYFRVQRGFFASALADYADRHIPTFTVVRSIDEQ